MGVSVFADSISSSTPGILAKGEVTPATVFGNQTIVVQGTEAARRIDDVLDSSYIVNGDTTYWTALSFRHDGGLNFQLHASNDDFGGDPGPEFTDDAESSLAFAIQVSGGTEYQWDFSVIAAADSTEPYSVDAATVTSAGQTNDGTFRNALLSGNAIVVLFDASHANIDGTNLEIADPPEAPAAPTVTSTGTDSISVALSADPTSDSPITSRDIRWKVASADDSTFTEVLGVTSPVAVSGLDDATEYAVQWRANSGAVNGTGAWSPSGTATTDSADLMPTIDAIADVTLEHGGTLNFTLPAPVSGDPPVALTLTGLASWMSWDPVNRRLTGTAPNAFSSTPLVYTATDDDGDQATRSFSVNVLLGLADFNSAGLETEALAVFQALRQGTNSYVWSRSPHPQGNRGSLVDGEMVLDILDVDVVLNAVRFRTSGGSSLGNGRISMEARGIPGYTSHLENYLLTGAGNDLTLHIQSSSLSYSFGVTTHSFDGGTDWARWDLPSDGQDVLSSIANGERFIFALTRPANAPPTVTIDTSSFIAEPNGVVNITGTVADAEDDNGSLTVTAATSLGTISTPVNTDGSWTCALTAPLGGATVQDMVVTITVTDSGGKQATAMRTWQVRAATLPHAPAAPTVTALSVTEARVAWVAPTTGDTPASFDLRYKRTEADDTSWNIDNNVTSPETLIGLFSGHEHEVQVRGVNAAGNGPWSQSGTVTLPEITLTLAAIPDITLTFPNSLDVTLPFARGGLGVAMYTLTPLASWMSFDDAPAVRRLTGTPPNADSTTVLTYTATATEGDMQTASRTFTVTVNADASLVREISAGHTLQSVARGAAAEQAAVAAREIAAGHTLQNVARGAAAGQVAPAARGISAGHTLQNVSPGATLQAVGAAVREIAAGHTLQNVVRGATAAQQSGVALGSIADQDARQGEAYTFCVPDATGGDTPYTWSATGLPTGTVIHAATGLIYGVPSVEETATVTVTVTDDSGNTDSQSFDIDVAAAVRAKDGIPFANDAVTSATEGVLVKGEVDPFSARDAGENHDSIDAVRNNHLTDGEFRNRIADQIDTAYIVSGGTAYFTFLRLADSGRLALSLSSTVDGAAGTSGPQFTEAAEDSIWIVLLYGDTSAAWDFSELDDSDETEPYAFSSDSVTAAGPTNTASLRNALLADDSVIVLLVDGDSDHIDVAGRSYRPRSDWQIEAVPTVDITTPAQTIFIGDQIKIAADVDRNGDNDRLIHRYTVSPNRGTFTPSYGKDTVWTAPQVRGDYDITLTVTDEDGNVVTDSVTITVAGVNFVEVDDIGVEVGDSHASTLPVATDGNGPYTYAVTNLPAGAMFNASTRALSWSPTAPGGRMVTYTATDTDTGHTFSRSFLMMAHLPSLASYVVLVDWNGDKRFAHANADIFPDVDRQSALRVKRGRNYGSQVYGRSVSGTLEAQLLNYHGRYDKDSSTSPLADLIVPRRRIVWAAAADSVVYRLWEGFLDRIDKQDRTGGDDMAKLTGYDIIALLTRDDDTSIPYTASTTTGAAADAIVEAGDVDSDDLGSFDGSTALRHFYQGKSSSWRQLQAVEEAEGGFLNVSGRGRLGMDARDARATRARSLMSQLTLTDSQTPGAGDVKILPGPKFRDPLKDLANLVRARVRTWTVGDEAELWRLDEELVLAAGESITLRPQYMASASSPAVSEWIDPQPCEDYQAWSMTGGAGDELTGTLDVDLVAGATEVALTLTNEHATATLYVNLLKLRGMRLEEGDPVEVEVRDDTSIEAYGVRPYTIATDLLSTVMDAKDYADEIIGLYAGPTRKGAVRIQANPIFADALPLELSDRVTLTLRDFTGAMYVEAIAHALTPGPTPRYGACA